MKILRASAFVAAAALLALGVAIIARGGFETTWAGARVSMHDPQRPVLLAGLAIAVAAWAHGFARSWTGVRDGFFKLDERLLLAAFAAGPVAWGIARGSLVGALSGGALVLATHRLGLGFGSSRLGVIAAWLVATSPTLYAAQVSFPTDVAAAAAWAIAWVVMIRGTTLSAVGAGVAASAAMLARSELAPVAGVMLLWLIWQALARGADRQRAFRLAVCFAATAVQGAVIAGAINFERRGSALAFDGNDFALTSFVPNLEAYAKAFTGLHTMWPLLGAAALVVLRRQVWPETRDRRLAASAGLCLLVIGVEGCLQTAWPGWEALRFFLPGWPFLMIGFAACARYAMRSGPPSAKLMAAWLVVWIGIRALLAGLGRGVFG